MANDTSLTPMMEQYFRIKELHRDALLFFRLGDFYEMFYEDAKVAAPVLDIALTSRQKVPMCGVPYHAVTSYLPKLLRAGFKVAICEQVEDPKAAKGVVRREVIKVLTPGTAVEVETEEAKEERSSPRWPWRTRGWGLALVDLAAGEIRTARRDLGRSEGPGRRALQSGAQGDPLSRRHGRRLAPRPPGRRRGRRRAQPGRGLALRSAPGGARRPRAFRGPVAGRFRARGEAAGRGRGRGPPRLRQARPEGLPGPRPPHLVPQPGRRSSSSTRRPSATSSSSATSATAGSRERSSTSSISP